MAGHDVVIHIGLHKTGSTFLQRAVFPKLRTWYLVTRPYTQSNEAFNRLQYADASLYEPDAIITEIKTLRARTDNPLLLSDESFSGKPWHFNYLNRTMIAERLARALPQATIVLFLRGQADIILSHYNQYIRGGGNLSLKDFVWKDSNFNTVRGNLHIDNFLYHQTIRTYRAYFQRCHVFLFEDLKTHPQLVAERLSAIFNEPFNESDLVPTTNNTNPSIAHIKAMRWVNRFALAVGDRRITTAARSLLARLPQREEAKEKQRGDVRLLIDGHYDDNNRLVVNAFPEIGLQRYPNKYPGASGSRVHHGGKLAGALIDQASA